MANESLLFDGFFLDFDLLLFFIFVLILLATSKLMSLVFCTHNALHWLVVIRYEKIINCLMMAVIFFWLLINELRT